MKSRAAIFAEISGDAPNYSSMPDAGQGVFATVAGVDESFGEGFAGCQGQLVGAPRCEVEALLHDLPPLTAVGATARTPVQGGDQVGDFVGDCFVEHVGRIELIGLQIEAQPQPADGLSATPSIYLPCRLGRDSAAQAEIDFGQRPLSQAVIAKGFFPGLLGCLPNPAPGVRIGIGGALGKAFAL